MNQDRTPSLKGLLVAQFFGAFNDNALKLFIALLAIRTLESQLGAGTPELESASQTQTTIAFIALGLPLMVFSVPAAWVADRFSKRTVLIGTKIVELILMLAGTTVMYLDPTGGPAGLVVLAAMGAQSAFFSPAKYGLLPEVLPEEKLTSGNGILELWTFLAIILGTAAGGLLLEWAGAEPWVAGSVLTVFAVVGLVAIQFLPRVPAARPDANLVSATRDGWRALWQDRDLRLIVLGSVVFWGVASLVNQNVLVYGKATLGLAEGESTWPLVATGLGIGIGSALVGRLSRGIDLGWIPLGSIGMALSATGMALFVPGFWGTCSLMVLLGICGGWVWVPLNAALQAAAPNGARGAVIALANALMFGGIVLGSLAADAFTRFGLSPAGVFGASAGMVGVATAWAMWLLPVSALRLALTLLTNTLYRVRVRGAQHIPETGGALLVANHMSFVDGLLLMASTQRPIRFLVYSDYYNRPLLKPFMRLLQAVPISGSDSPRALLKSMRDAGQHLEEGDLVCIFAEGAITRTGLMLPFQRGLERLVKGRDVPIIPLYLDRVWGSVFSFEQARIGSGKLRRLSLPRPVTVAFGTPLPSTSSRRRVRDAVRDLSAEAWLAREEEALPLHYAVVSAARRAPWAFAAADAERKKISRIKLLTSSIALARALRGPWQGQTHVGVMLPPSVAGAAVNVAASLAAKTVVNLNFTAGQAALTSAAKQSGLTTVVTSKKFLEQAKVALPEGVTPLFAEDLAAGIGGGAKLWATLLALFAPRGAMERACGATRRIAATDIASVLFSSGSTGEPKGVELSHFNLSSNGDAVGETLPIDASDRLLGVLPLFHSFGTMSLWFALRRGMGLVFHPNPLDAPMIGKLVKQRGVTAVLATPTFLQLYLRRCEPGQFGAVRLMITGAEKLPARLAAAAKQTFGIDVLEGYGATECSPVIAVGAPHFRAPGVFQQGNKPGSVGQPLPGMAVRVVDPDSFVEVEPGETGMLLVRGPNVMCGYLGRDDLTQKAMRDGYYVTGDLAHVDDEGYLHIGDRLSRFSKIGGEMVPHGTVEQALHEAANRQEPTFAVTGVPDARKGERLVVLHTLSEARIPEVLEALGRAGLPNLFVPKKDDFVPIEALPMLGTGKLDLRQVKRVATEARAPASS